MQSFYCWDWLVYPGFVYISYFVYYAAFGGSLFNNSSFGRSLFWFFNLSVLKILFSIVLFCTAFVCLPSSTPFLFFYTYVFCACFCCWSPVLLSAFIFGGCKSVCTFSWDAVSLFLGKSFWVLFCGAVNFLVGWCFLEFSAPLMEAVYVALPMYTSLWGVLFLTIKIAFGVFQMWVFISHVVYYSQWAAFLNHRRGLYEG